MKYYFNIEFHADNMDGAEDIAAELAEFRPSKGQLGRNSLWYEDPITGKPALWAEPVMSTEQLTARRTDQ